MKLAIKSGPIGLYQFAERVRPENVLPSARIHYRSETVMAGAAAPASIVRDLVETQSEGRDVSLRGNGHLSSLIGQ